MNMRRTSFAIVLVLASLALVAAGCGGDDDETTSTSSTTEETTGTSGATGEGGDTGASASEVGMTEYSFDPADLSLASGDSIDVVNDGELPHNLTVEGEDVATSDLDPGANEELTVDLDPGDYDFLCTIGDHAAQGMTGTLTVE
jgi:plastocyanin